MSLQNELPAAGGPDFLTQPPPPPRGPLTIQSAMTTNLVLTELPANHLNPQGGVDGEAPAPCPNEVPLQIKNGIQAQAEMPQQQKLNKRRYSMNVGFKHPSLGKRRRRANSECDPVLPTNFLMGGNIFDPLNLNSLLDEEVSKVHNAETPKSSPLPVKNRDPVEILIPKDITDPLNLNGTASGVLVSPVKSRRRHRNRHHVGVATGVPGQVDLSDGEKPKGNDGSTSGPSFPSAGLTEAHASADAPVVSGLPAVEESPKPYELNTSINCRDEVVQPILPRRRSHPSTSSSAPQAQARSISSTSSTQPSKHWRHRRSNSRSDRLSITPSLPTKQPMTEKAHSQTFHTPVAGSATQSLGSQKVVKPQHKPKRKFQYGNYSRYYGYRTPALTMDPRLAMFKSKWFSEKKVLDIGCNTGHITLAIAKHWCPSQITGLDIDGALIHAARQNLRHFISELQVQECCGSLNPDDKKQSEGDVKSDGAACQGSEIKDGADAAKPEVDGERKLPRFPVSFTRCRGPLATPPIMPHVPGLFPCNVTFLKGNYVPDNDVAVMSQRAEYDVILCLSVTKWVHLNFGDTGIKRLFHRMYRHVLPGGMLILEPQPWSSYGRRKRLTEATYRNYSSIRLKPDQFSSFLISEVGFSSYELIGTPQNCSKGFQRPIYLFHKSPGADRK